MTIEPGTVAPEGVYEVVGAGLRENLGVVIAQLEAGYTITLRAQVAEQLARDPYVNLFSLDDLDTCVIRPPDNMSASDVDEITATFGSGSLRSLLGGAVQMPNEAGLLGYVRGETPGFKVKSKEELRSSLKKLEKIVAFLKALVVVLNEKRKEYRVTEELDRQAPMGDRDAANRVASLDAVVRVLNEIDTRAMKTRMEGLERIVGVVSKSLTERATPSTTITE